MGRRTPLRRRRKTSGTGDTFPAAAPAWLRPAPGLRVTVVGGDGFIGSHVVVAALASGAAVDAICLATPWRLASVDDRRLKRTRLPDDVWWSEDAAAAAMPSGTCDVMVVLAYRPPRGAHPETHEREVNLGGAVYLAAAAGNVGAAVVFASSAAVYGQFYERRVPETQAPAPATPYAATKLAAERALMGLVPASRLSITRISTVYGPGENGPRAIPSFVRALARGEPPTVHGDGLDVHDYIHVADVAAAVVNAAAAAARDEANGVVNVGSGRGRTTLEALAAVQAALGTDAELASMPSPRAPSRLVLDVGLGRRRLGLDPREDFEAAVAAEARWLVSQRRVG